MRGQRRPELAAPPIKNGNRPGERGSKAAQSTTPLLTNQRNARVFCAVVAMFKWSAAVVSCAYALFRGRMVVRIIQMILLRA
jgi:hypothetical protein